jgi:hypothetical protein
MARKSAKQRAQALKNLKKARAARGKRGITARGGGKNAGGMPIGMRTQKGMD